MSLKQQINDQVKQAMKAGEKQRLKVLRMLTAAIKQKEVDERVELDDAQVLAIIDKQVKQRRESIEQYTAGGRAELAEASRPRSTSFPSSCPSSSAKTSLKP